MRRVDVRGPSHGLQRMRDGFHVVPLVFRLLLRQADARQLRVGEDRRGQDGVVRSRAVRSEHVVDREPRLVLRHGRELRDAVDVARGPDSRRARPHPVVDDDAQLRGRDAGGGEVELLDVRDAPRGEQDPLDAELARVAALTRDDRDAQAVVLP